MYGNDDAVVEDVEENVKAPLPSVDPFASLASLAALLPKAADGGEQPKNPIAGLLNAGLASMMGSLGNLGGDPANGQANPMAAFANINNLVDALAGLKEIANPNADPEQVLKILKDMGEKLGIKKKVEL